MSRPGITSQMRTLFRSDESSGILLLVELFFSDGVLRINTSINTVSILSNSWLPVGGQLELNEGIAESNDINSAEVSLKLSAIDPTIAGRILTQNYIGRVGNIYYARTDPNTYAIVSNPYLFFPGRMNGGFTLEEDIDSAGDPGSAVITGRIQSRLADTNQVRGIFTNVGVHNLYYSGDRFFENVPRYNGQVIKWGPR